MQATPEEIEFRISEVIDWVREFIYRGDTFNAGLWAQSIAHSGRILLDYRVTHGR